VRDEFNSVTYVVRNMANDAFDQKFGNHNKNQLSKCYDWKGCLAFHCLVKADFSLEIAPITRVMALKAKGSANYDPPCISCRSRRLSSPFTLCILLGRPQDT